MGGVRFVATYLMKGHCLNTLSRYHYPHRPMERGATYIDWPVDRHCSINELLIGWRGIRILTSTNLSVEIILVGHRITPLSFWISHSTSMVISNSIITAQNKHHNSE